MSEGPASSLWPGEALGSCVLVPERWYCGAEQRCQPGHHALFLIREQGFKSVMEAVGADHRR